MEILILIIILLTWGLIKTYNLIKPTEIAIDEAQSNITVILQKRTSILDKLNEIVNSYSKYEKDIVEKLSSDMTPTKDSTFNINRLYDVYPDLKLNTTFETQIDRLYEIETERQNALNRFNSTVRTYNELVNSFPKNVFSKVLSFQSKPFFS